MAYDLEEQESLSEIKACGEKWGLFDSHYCHGCLLGCCRYARVAMVSNEAVPADAVSLQLDDLGPITIRISREFKVYCF